MRILFRVDASQRIGTGHVKRCQSLAIALRAAGNEVHFLWRDQGLDLSPWLDGFSSTCLPEAGGDEMEMTSSEQFFAGVTNALDAEQCLAFAKVFQPDWVIVDNYAFDERWHRIVNAGSWAIAAIDDLADRRLDVDVVIDQNFHPDHRQKYGGLLPPHASILGGPDYAMLSPDYENLSVVEIDENVGSIGVFMGGADDIDASSIVLDAVDQLGYEGMVELVTTKANPNRHRLEQRCAQSRHMVFSVDLPSLSGFFSRHGVQVGAGGSATWERCRLGVPTLAVCCADNQREILQHLVAAGVQRGVNKPDREAIAAGLRDLLEDAQARREIGRRAGVMVDGRGARRISNYLSVAHKIGMPSAPRLRPATIDDAKILFRWRNDDLTRLQSVNRSEISWDEHRAWVAAKLADESCSLLIAEMGEPLGTVRLERTCENGLAGTILSWTVSPLMRGRGVGTAIVRAAKPAGLVWAYIKSGNAASRSIALKTGFELVCDGPLQKWESR